jgi:DNA-binding transcriptional MocR family regulator
LAPLQQGQFASDGPPLIRRLATPHLVRLLGEWRGGGVAYLELAAALRALIVEGRLPPYTRLPSERALAVAVSVSRNTATGALEVLRQEGYLESRRGAGSWIRYPAPAAARPDERFPAATGVLDMTVASPPAPADLATLASAAAAALGGELGTSGYAPFGLGAARSAVAAHLGGQGLATDPEQVLITQGSLHGFDLCLRTLTRPGDRVLVETPTYPAALDAIAAHHCRAVGVPVGDDGWDVAQMRAALRDARPRLAYVIPDFHNPTGRSASDVARARLAREARAAGVTIISDEGLADLWLAPSPARPRAGSLGGALPRAPVLVLGSLSKIVWGGLRTGWIRGDPELLRRIAGARSSQDICGPVLDQLLAVEALRRFEAIAADRRAQLRERCGALIDALAQHRPGWRVSPPSGGLCLWVDLPEGVSGSALAVRALRHGVRVAPGARFGPDGGYEGRLRLPFTLPPDQLTEAVRRLAAAEDGLAQRAPGRGAAPRWVA